MKLACICILLLTACGAASDQPVSSTESALTCGAEPHDNGDGTVTTVGCAWEQQYANIMAHGHALPGSASVVAGGTVPGVMVNQQCGEWLLGQDSSGVTIFVSSKDGSVRSHGVVHAGFAASSLSSLPLPISLK